eukprot:11201434-Lingulodinium_polyedra.AAC.1
MLAALTVPTLAPTLAPVSILALTPWPAGAGLSDLLRHWCYWALPSCAFHMVPSILLSKRPKAQIPLWR